MALMNRIVAVLSIGSIGLLSSCSLFQGSGQTCPAYSSNEEAAEEKQEKAIVLDTEKEEFPKS